MVNWKKVPSVTTGGKPYFYVLFLDKYSREEQVGMGLDSKVSVAWNRRAKKWEASTGGNFEKSLGFFKDEEEAKSVIEARLPSKPFVEREDLPEQMTFSVARRSKKHHW